MKSAQLPPVRVSPSVREEIEGSLREGESLSEFVTASALQAARRRVAQRAFLERGRASLRDALQTGKLYDLDDALSAMSARIQKQSAQAGASPARRQRP